MYRLTDAMVRVELTRLENPPAPKNWPFEAVAYTVQRNVRKSFQIVIDHLRRRHAAKEPA